MTPDFRQVCTLLAALRLYQARITGESPSDDDYEDIASNAGQVKPLDEYEIDALCDAINIKLPENFRVCWEIDSDAETPLEAAQEAWRAMRRVDSTANAFTVLHKDGTVTEVDLEKKG